MTTQSQATINVPISTDFPINRIIDLMVGGFEQSIYYWARRAKHEIPEGFDMEAYRRRNGFTDRWEYGTDYYQIHDFYLAPFVGGAIIFEEFDEGDCSTTNVHRLDLAAIQRGLALMAAGGPEGKKWDCKGSHFADWLNEDDDATTADVFIQCCVLGDIVYG